MGPALYSWIKTPDAGIPLLQIESEVMAAEHRSSPEYVKLATFFKLDLQVSILET